MTDELLPPAIDVACGSRSFYFDKEDARVLKCDAHPRHPVLLNGRTLDVSPDIVADFRELPFPDESFSLVIFDPPYLIGNRRPKTSKTHWVLFMKEPKN